jgi:branched-chain amino acid aminotransferase
LRPVSAPDQSRTVSAIWCNGDFLEGPLGVSPHDRGLTHGLGVFETVLALEGRPVALGLHLERMAAGAERLGLDAARVDVGIIGHAIINLLLRVDLAKGRARVRIALTSGSADLRTLDPGEDSLLWITAAPAADPSAAVSLVTAPFPRNETSPLAGIKCLSYAENLVALDYARRMGADECLFYNTRGELCEATTSNVFLVRDGEVITPSLSSGCLPGTMRSRVIDACRERGIGVREMVLRQTDLLDAIEVFTTSAIRGVMPVSSIDGRTLPDSPVARILATHGFTGDHASNQ